MLNPAFKRHFPVTLALTLPALLGSGLIFYATRWGPWGFSDSVAYIDIARNLLLGRGLGMITPAGNFQPMLHFPPLYSLALALLGLPGLDLITAARWLDVVLFGLLLFTISFTFYRLVHPPDDLGRAPNDLARAPNDLSRAPDDQSLAPGDLGRVRDDLGRAPDAQSRAPEIVSCLWVGLLAVLLGLSPALVFVYTLAISEPLANFLGFLSLCLLLLYIENRRRALFYTAILACGLALLTRYVAVAFLITGIILLLAFDRPSWKKRFGEGLVYAAVSVLPLLAWLVRVYVLSQTLGNRHLFFSASLGLAFQSFRKALVPVLWHWLPTASQVVSQGYSYQFQRNLVFLAAALLLGAFLAVAVLYRARKTRLEGRSDLRQGRAALRLFALFLIFTAVYIFCLAGAYLFTQPTPDINERTLSPANLALLASVITLLAALAHLALPGRRWNVILPAAGALFLAAAYLPATASLVQDLHLNGGGYTSPTWTQSETIQTVRDLPPDVSIISNESAPVLLLTGRPAFEIAELSLQNHGLPLTPYGSDPSEPGQALFSQNKAALVLFNTLSIQFYNRYQANAPRRMAAFTQGLYLYKQCDDGAIYFFSAYTP